MFLYCNAVMEPWDGPAAIAATDGRWVIAGLDRNGLRPLRFTVTRHAMLIVGSETGMVKLDEADILEKGRVGPGQTIAVDLDHARFFADDDLKDLLAARHPYGEWARQIRQIDHIVQTDAPEPALWQGEALRRRQLAAGVTLEELETILHPMVEDAQEAVGSMGDDTPVAVLSDSYRGLQHYFRQNFSQVTNPPIDSLRETRVMTLKTRLGNLGNVLDEDFQPVRPAATGKPGAVHRRVRGDARPYGRHRLRGGLHVSRRRRGSRLARRARAHPPRGRGRRAQRLQARDPHR